MNVEEFYRYVMSRPAATEGFPFGEGVAVFKVAGKMFATLWIEEPPYTTNLKCDPERAVDLRDRFDGVRPGYHMNKKHWNTVDLDSDVPSDLIRNLVDHSYQLVIEGLPKRRRPDG